MKSKTTYGFLTLAALLAACSPVEPDQRTGGTPDGLSPEQVSIVKKASDVSPNKILFSLGVKDATVPYSAFWDLGNGQTVKGEKAEGIYPEHGTYTVQLMVYTADGNAVLKKETIVLADDDYSLISSPVYLMLTGGKDVPEGRTWVFDRWNRYTAEVAAATGKAVGGHIGLGEANGGYQGWWSAGANDKAAAPNHHYNFRLTFKLSGMELLIETDGKGNGRSACTASWTDYTAIDADEGEFSYAGGRYSFSINEQEGGNPVLSLPEGAILGYYVCNDVYEIIYQSDEVLALRTQQGEDFDWVYVFIREDLNVPPQE
jgi:PKD repeat protein